MSKIIEKVKKFFEPRDLTKGKIFKELSLFLIPILLSTVFQQLYSLTDTIIVGQNLNENQIAGINDAVPIANVILNFAMGLTSGFSSILANKFGSKDEKGLRNSLFVQLFLSLCFSIILTITAVLLIDPLLSIMKIVPSQENKNLQEIYKNAHDYLLIYFLIGITASLFYNFATATLRSISDSFTPFVILVCSSLVNIGLDILFVLPLKMGVLGTALATVISQSLSAVIALIYMFTKYKFLRFNKEDLKLSWKEIYRCLKMGVPIALQWAGIYIGVMCMTASIIPFDRSSDGSFIEGNPAQVGYGVANKLSGIIMSFLSAMCSTLIAFVSQNRGAKQDERVIKGIKIGTLINIIIGLTMMCVGYLLMINGAYQYLFLSKDKVTDQTLKYGNTYLFVSLPFFFFLSLIDPGRGSLDGFEKPLIPFISGILELVGRVICTTLFPYLINGCNQINANANFNCYIMISFADPITWVLAALICMIPLLIIVNKLKKEIKQENLISNN